MDFCRSRSVMLLSVPTYRKVRTLIGRLNPVGGSGKKHNKTKPKLKTQDKTIWVLYI